MHKYIFNKALRVLLLTNGIILLAGAMLGPIYALFVEDIGGDLMDASIAGFLFAISAGIVTLLSGKFSDRIKRSDRVVILGYFMIGLGFFLFQYIETVTALFALQVLIGMGEAIYSPAFDKLYSENLDEGKYGTAWGAWESIYYFTTAFGALLGGLIVTNFGFSVLFLSMAILSFGSGIYLLIISPKRLL